MVRDNRNIALKNMGIDPKSIKTVVKENAQKPIIDEEDPMNEVNIGAAWNAVKDASKGIKNIVGKSIDTYKTSYRDSVIIDKIEDRVKVANNRLEGLKLPLTKLASSISEVLEAVNETSQLSDTAKEKFDSNTELNETISNLKLLRGFANRLIHRVTEPDTEFPISTIGEPKTDAEKIVSADNELNTSNVNDEPIPNMDDDSLYNSPKLNVPKYGNPDIDEPQVNTTVNSEPNVEPTQRPKKVKSTKPKSNKKGNDNSLWGKYVSEGGKMNISEMYALVDVDMMLNGDDEEKEPVEEAGTHNANTGVSTNLNFMGDDGQEYKYSYDMNTHTATLEDGRQFDLSNDFPDGKVRLSTINSILKQKIQDSQMYNDNEF
jgi:hypothetical protein